MPTLTISVLVHNWADWLVDGKFLPIDAESGELGVEVGEVAALRQRVI